MYRLHGKPNDPRFLATLNELHFHRSELHSVGHLLSNEVGDTLKRPEQTTLHRNFGEAMPIKVVPPLTVNALIDDLPL